MICKVWELRNFEINDLIFRDKKAFFKTCRQRLENLLRNMGGTVKKGRLSKPEHRGKQWTILCVGESGVISSFKLSKNTLIIMGICVGVFLLVTIAAILTYGIMKVENINLRSK